MGSACDEHAAATRWDRGAASVAALAAAGQDGISSDDCRDCTENCDGSNQLDDASKLQVLTLQDGRTCEHKDPTHKGIRWSLKPFQNLQK